METILIVGSGIKRSLALKLATLNALITLKPVSADSMQDKSVLVTPLEEVNFNEPYNAHSNGVSRNGKRKRNPNRWR